MRERYRGSGADREGADFGARLQSREGSAQRKLEEGSKAVAGKAAELAGVAK